MRWHYLFMIGLLAGSRLWAEQATIDFTRDIQPILADRCYACHGPDSEQREADLRLDVESAAKASAIVPGNASESDLVARITSDDPDTKMPPPDSGKRLTSDEIARIQLWIDQGAGWRKHWSFAQPQRVQPPAVDNASWARNPIDRFVLDRLKREGLTPAPRAARETLIRRLSFDLTGLPPTPKQVDTFLHDRSANAYEQLVDRLLESPHYGERLAMVWLDGARYADTNGYQNDFGRSMWAWRDWVIDAFNRNLPYDQFVIQQIAGDLLPDATQSQIVATGFNRNHRAVTEFGSIDEEWHVENVVDRVETTSAVFLGLTIGCARCHDHKYDPVTQRDFYRFFAFFNNVKEKGVYAETRGNVPPLIELRNEHHELRLKELDSQIANATSEIEQQNEALTTSFEHWKQQLDSGLRDAARPLPAAEIPLQGDLRAQMYTSEATQLSVRPGSKELAWTSGLVGQALRFPGQLEGHLGLGAYRDWDRDHAFAFSMWVYREGSGALISKIDDDAFFRGWDTIVLEDGRIKVHMVHAWPSNAIAVTTRHQLPRQVWSQIVVSYDGSGGAGGIRIYVSGKQQDTAVEQDGLDATLRTDQPIRLGRRSGSLPFDGSISHVRLFDAAVTQADVDAWLRADLGQALLVAKDEQTSSQERDAWMRKHFEAFHTEAPLPARGNLDRLNQEKKDFIKSIPTVMVMQEREERRPTYLLQRGQYDAADTSQELSPGVPGFLGVGEGVAMRSRLELARWLVAPQNPLVARVAVNRIWQRLFGKGLVVTSEDFGVQGEPPTHPDLLDWLATELIRMHWDLKAFQKQIVMSATYCQLSTATDAALERDPENRLLSRGARFRLPAELIRDNALAISGLLIPMIGGPSVKPYQPSGLWLELAGGASQGAYEPSEGGDLYRRSLYTYRKRTVPHPTLTTFDAPSWEICRIRRATTNTPIQSLALLNDPTYVEAARVFAERMLSHAETTAEAKLASGFRLATGRRPNDVEIKTLQRALARYVGVYTKHPAAAERLLDHGESQANHARNASELAAYTTVASILLNLDETITKE